MGSEFLFYFAFNAFRNYPQPPASHYCWIYYLCTDEPLVRGSLLESRQRPPAQGNPERKSISEMTALPKGNASPNGTPSRKETHLRKDPNPERKRIPGGEKNCNVMLESLGLFGLFIGVMLSATLVPFSSDALYVGALLIGKTPVVLTLLVATAGSWAGAMITYYLGRFAKWEWLVKHFDVKVETLEKQKVRIDRYGVWLSALCWTPFFGEAVMIALGFYKCRPLPIYLLTLAGVFVRYVIWTLVLV